MQRMSALLKRITQLSKYLVVDGLAAVEDGWYAIRVHARRWML